MAEKWMNLKKMMDIKREINRKKEKTKIPFSADEIIVQRLSTNVSGKAQKYSRIGPREFVSYKKDNLTFEGITSAFQDYYALEMDADQMINIIEIK